jgi:hypothetical protein
LTGRFAHQSRQAGELVDAMNARLERVGTASNVAVRLVWQVAPDLPPGTKAAGDLLLKDPIRSVTRIGSPCTSSSVTA